MSCFPRKGLDLHLCPGVIVSSTAFHSQKCTTLVIDYMATLFNTPLDVTKKLRGMYQVLVKYLNNILPNRALEFLCSFFLLLSSLFLHSLIFLSLSFSRSSMPFDF